MHTSVYYDSAAIFAVNLPSRHACASQHLGRAQRMRRGTRGQANSSRQGCIHVQHRPMNVEPRSMPEAKVRLYEYSTSTAVP